MFPYWEVQHGPIFFNNVSLLCFVSRPTFQWASCFAEQLTVHQRGIICKHEGLGIEKRPETCNCPVSISLLNTTTSLLFILPTNR
jgi:hypothetical protein